VTAKPDTVPVVCAIIERGDRFLAAKRGAGQTNALLWEFPGGKVKKGEFAETALIRELHEELGISVKLITRLAPCVYIYPWMTIELIPFVCEIVAGEPHLHEHAEIRWIDKEEASGLAWAAADVPVLVEYHAISGNP
jgi:8-oxo-dGTP diphosphatase